MSSPTLTVRSYLNPYADIFMAGKIMHLLSYSPNSRTHPYLDAVITNNFLRRIEMFARIAVSGLLLDAEVLISALFHVDVHIAR